MKENSEPASDDSSPPCPSTKLETIPDADIIVRSSDQVTFPVRKSVLAMSSPFFKDMLSLPQPPDGEVVDGLPVVQLPEDADVLKSLISFIYPIYPILPYSYDKVFALLAACQKYDIDSIQSYIRSEVKRRPYLEPSGTEVFRAYALANSMALRPEIESMARLTLNYPMTFEFLGEGLRWFEGPALGRLIRYRRRCRDSLVSRLNSFFKVPSRHQIWRLCLESGNRRVGDEGPPDWLSDFFSSKRAELQTGFTRPIGSPSTILKECITALKNHLKKHNICDPCFRAYVRDGATFRRELENELTKALNQVNSPSSLDHYGSLISSTC